MWSRFCSALKNAKNVVNTLECHRSIHLDLHGIFPALTTPFDANENVDYEQLEKNMKIWQSIPFKGYMVMGSTGEVVSLSVEERVEVVRHVRKLVPRDDKLLLAGPGCQSTRETIDLVQRMSEVGADAVVVVNPSYYRGRLTKEAIEKHYIKVADASPVPVVLYNVPMNTGIDLDPDMVISLSKHANIVAVKDSGGDIAKLAYMVHGTRSTPGFQVLAGSSSFLMPAIDVGCVGGILASGTVLGPQVCKLMQLLESGQRKDSVELQQRIVGPNWAVTKVFGIPGLKQVMDWCGFYGGPTRSPLLPLTAKEKESLRATFRRSGFLD